MSAIALRYAQAFAAVVASHKLDALATRKQLSDFNDTLAESHALREVLSNPAIPSDQKLRVLDVIASRLGVLPQVRNFLAVIMDHQRIYELSEILDEYRGLADEQASLTEAEVTTAHPLNSQDRAELEAQVAKLAGSHVRATYREDSSLLGGVVVRIGSTVYDGSIKAQLLGLKQKLISA
ncbi:ATP synthase F1 subunit delta [Edaphobacter bradus]|uniref:ATP synthase F1 subunit delta n=1 Tax=Edaphobacter bradus TaxID=2259016 RepID=UPI0021E01242|nr:ATP synthase F1 subunit delta [Edaphobacter bradus]